MPYDITSISVGDIYYYPTFSSPHLYCCVRFMGDTLDLLRVSRKVACKTSEEAIALAELMIEAADILGAPIKPIEWRREKSQHIGATPVAVYSARKIPNSSKFELRINDVHYSTWGALSLAKKDASLHYEGMLKKCLYSIPEIRRTNAYKK